MDFEKQKTPQEIAQIKKERTLSDAGLLNGGAEYEVDDKGNETFLATDKQIENARKEMGEDLEQEKRKFLENLSEDERKYLDEFLKHAKRFSDVGNMLDEGKITDDIFHKTELKYLELYNRDVKPLGEKIGKDRSMEIWELYKKFNPDLKKKSAEELKSEGGTKKEGQDSMSLLSKDCGFEIEGTAIGVPKTFMFRGKEWRINSYDPETKQLSIEIPLEHKTSMTLEEFKKINQPKLFKNHRSDLELQMFKGLRDKVDNWEKLYRLIEDSGGIQGINGFFEPDRLINIIKQAREKRLDVSRIPNTLGLRDKIIELLKIEEVRKKINPENPEGPSDLSQENKMLDEKDFENLGINEGDLGKPYSFSRSETLSSIYGEYPEIGVNGLRTEQGRINGKLVWCNGEIAIFETPEGKIKVPFRKLISPSGETYEQIERKRKDKKRRRIFVTKPKERAL